MTPNATQSPASAATNGAYYSASPMASGLICIGSIAGQPVFAGSEQFSTTPAHAPYSGIDPRQFATSPSQAHMGTPFFSTLGTVGTTGPAPMAKGLVCIGSINGQPVFAANSGAPGQAPAANGAMSMAPLGTGQAAVAPAATGLICIGSINGQPVFATPKPMAPQASASLPFGPMANAAGSPAAIEPAASGLICIGSVNGQPMFAQLASQPGFLPAGATGSYAKSGVMPAASGAMCFMSADGQLAPMCF